MKKLLLLLGFCCASILAPIEVRAASGDLDRSFGDAGIWYPEASATTYSLAIQADDKVLAGGQCFAPGFGTHFCVIRHLTNGSADVTFGFNARAYYPIGSGSSNIQKLKVLPDGKILAVGYTDVYDPAPGQGHFYQVAVVRYNANGTLDQTFNGDGIYTNPVAGFYGTQAFDVVVQPDGKIVVIGTGGDNSGRLVALRLDPDGFPDNSFGTNGIVDLWQGFVGVAPRTVSAVLQPDGKILIAGNSAFAMRYMVIRLTSTGALDPTFASNGIVGFNIGPSTGDMVRRVVLLPEGKILVAGSSQPNSGSWVVLLARITSNGALDSTFGANGIVLSNLAPGSHTFLDDILLQQDGKIVVAGSLGISGNVQAVSARYRADGGVDTQYGDKGQLRVPLEGNFVSVVRQSDGKLVFGGTRSFSPNDVRFFLARVLDNGTRDADFDNDRRSDVSVFRPSTATWHLLNSTTGYKGVNFGLATDRIVPADYDGDGTNDIAVFREGVWYLLRSSDSVIVTISFGQNGDIPVPADYDGDHRADLAVFRTGDWYILNSRDGSVRGEQFGQAGDEPLIGNFDGDLRADLAVFRGGWWYVNGSVTGFVATKFGYATDQPVPGDYDSDGRTDFAVYRDGVWYLQQSFAGFSAVQFGNPTDRPSPADFDGDGRTDPAVYRDGAWYQLRSTAGFQAVSFGVAGDVPVPSAYLP